MAINPAKHLRQRSALLLAANTDLPAIRPEAVEKILADLGLRDPAKPAHLCIASAALQNLFEPGNEWPPRLFRPDGICFCDEVDIICCEVEQGASVLITGSGRLGSWTIHDLRSFVRSSGPQRKLRETMNRIFGGRHVMPAHIRRDLEKARLDGDDGWIWFMQYGKDFHILAD